MGGSSAPGVFLSWRVSCPASPPLALSHTIPDAWAVAARQPSSFYFSRVPSKDTGEISSVRLECLTRPTLPTPPMPPGRTALRPLATFQFCEAFLVFSSAWLVLRNNARELHGKNSSCAIALAFLNEQATMMRFDNTLRDIEAQTGAFDIERDGCI